MGTIGDEAEDNNGEVSLALAVRTLAVVLSGRNRSNMVL